jgi:hypothetical protein
LGFLPGSRRQQIHPKIEILEAAFSVLSVPRLYNEDQRDKTEITVLAKAISYSTDRLTEAKDCCDGSFV